MGRSKFPGKPSKHILRKRINVLPPAIEIRSVEYNGPVTVGSVVEYKQDDIGKEENSERSFSQNVNKKISVKRRLTRKMKSSLRSTDSSQRSLLTRLCTKSVSKIKKGARTALTRKSVHNFSSTCRTKSATETTNLVGKFVLPTRSVHSSRVIKPNKRFISDLNESITLKKKVSIVKKCMKQEDDKSRLSAKSIENGSFNSDNDKTAFTNGQRVVLRQARLKLPNQMGTQGPFTKPNNSPSGTVTCGVCGAIRFYRFVKQARKFNIYSCESCRKFITKMIKRQACGGQNAQTTLVCNRGQGTCHVSPIIKSQQWKLTKCPYRSRCPACWLKMCLRAFHMPSSLKQSLSQMLPRNMQSPDVLFNSALPPLLWQANVESKMMLDKTEETTIVKQRPVRFKNPKVQTVTSPFVPNSDIRRQKIDLKGPRVKHVCRSASIVLGQPIATFTDGEKKCDSQNQPVTHSKSADEKSLYDKNAVESKYTGYSKSESSYSEPESDKVPKPAFLANDSVESSSRRERSSRHLSLSSHNSFEAREPEVHQNLDKVQNGIYIDYCDNYDPDDIYQNGFCLIGSEQFQVTAVCFLCGSAGRDPLYYCSVCCEPYHSFCLEKDDIRPPKDGKQQHPWICPRCVSCSKCNQIERQKISCQKCSKAYHMECFNPKFVSEDRPMVCSHCMKCKNCSSINITKFIGNLLLCITCFKLRRKGCFCPVCKQCYEDDDHCIKIMECAKCVKWVHAKCENLTEEQYRILCLLPESVQYTCSLCSDSTSHFWRKFVNAELKYRFNKVLRNLSRHKLSRHLLKSSQKSPISYRSVASMRRLEFSEDLDLDNNNYSKDITDINKIYSFEENEKNEFSMTKLTNCLSVIDIKNKINSNDYNSIQKFYKDLEECLKTLKSEQILKILLNIFQNIFPWFKSSEEFAQIGTTNSNESQNSYIMEEYESDSEIVSSTSDFRKCGFCQGLGDGVPSRESRLLYCGQNEWVHANCAFWSSEVYEEIDGSLQNVQTALNRGQLAKCSHCKQKGATVGCCYRGCHETYHFNCGRIVKLNFLYDKTVYCQSHELPKRNLIINKDGGFLIQRSLFIELDNKKRKMGDINKINVMIGSLCVKNLGKVDPVASDQTDVLVPMGFVCIRMFWSTIEPWKVVPYTIMTSLQNSHSNTLAVDRNFTVDHSLDKHAVDQILKELNAWHKDMDKKTLDIESEDDEEQQNGADILSPELTDAILEDLPGDILDGISVQDIFPKFSYDDLISMDFKNDISSSESVIESSKREQEDELDQDLKCRNLKRVKSEVYSSNKLDNLSKSRPPQRSCSLSINCKIDSSLSPVIKKRKITVARENNLIYQLLQVDGNFDDSGSECGSPSGQAVSNTWENYGSEQPVTCEKCQCTYRTQASYKRHLDSCDALCTSESDSEMMPDQEMITAYVSPTGNGMDARIAIDVAEPAVMASYESYQNEIHTSVLDTQSFIASKSTAELIGAPPPLSEVVIQQSLPQTVDQKQLIQTIPVNTVADQAFTISQPTIAISEASISVPHSQPQFCVNQTVPLCVNPLAIQQNSLQVNTTPSYAGNQLLSINASGSISLNPITHPTNSITVNQIGQQPMQHMTIQSVPLNNAILNVGAQNQYSLNGKLITNPVIQTVNVPGTHWLKQVNKPIGGTHSTFKPRARSRTIAAKKPAQFEDGDAIILPATSTSGQLIVQQIPSTNYVPTFMDTTFQQAGQNLQYVATIAPQTLSTQPLVQIQPDNNIISIVPNLQQTMYVQQPRVLENQLVIDSNGTIGWSQQQALQPVYYGFETIVQNTVMQSQQFLPTTVPGVLTANSSYSTTTQVFQTSKLEPVLDVSSNSFVLVNPGQIVNSQPAVNSQQIVNPQAVVNSQQIVNPQAVVSSQQMVNSQPIVNAQQLISSQPVNNSPPQPVSHQYSRAHHVNLVKNSVSQARSDPKSAQLEMKSSQPQMKIKPPDITSISSHVKLTQPQNEVKVKQPRLEVKSSQPQFEAKPQFSFEVKSSQNQNTKQTYLLSTSHKTNIPTSHSITLPTSPFVPEQGIPTNIVTPIPKPPTSTQNRPMSRVLPMPTTNILKDSKQVISDDEKPFIIEKPKEQVISSEEIKTPIKQLSKMAPIIKVEPKKIEVSESKVKTSQIKSFIKEDRAEYFETFEPAPKILKVDSLIVAKSPPKEPVAQKVVDISVNEDTTTTKLDTTTTKVDTSLKLIFQKQGDDGTYKISNNFLSKQPIQVAPLKPIKSVNYSSTTQESSSQPMLDGQNKEEKVEKSSSEHQKPQKSKKEGDAQSSILYTIETQDGFKYSSSSVTDLWSKVVDAVQAARAAHNMPPLPVKNGNLGSSVHILGLKSNGLKYLVEQVPGATKCSKYKSMFNFPPRFDEIDDELTQDHMYGSIRCAPCTNKKSEPYDMFGWLSSKHRQPEEISLDTLELMPRRVVNLPMAMKFRQLKLTSKYSVGVYRSCIHGRGLFCLRDIEAGEMVIEYAGEVIRSILTDKREKYYNSKSIGCYMFRVDDNFVVDATMKGNAARFINHSCDPNCYSRVVEILGHKHIIIFALRRILSGEELTYDYKFPFEEDKIPCTCGSRKCRKFLN